MERKPTTAKSRTRLSSVANSLRLIKAFSEDEYEIGISDLAKRLGLAKSTVHRLPPPPPPGSPPPPPPGGAGGGGKDKNETHPPPPPLFPPLLFKKKKKQKKSNS